MKYKRNHFIPRFMIEYWADPQHPHKGVHVYDIAGCRTYVSAGDCGKAYSFATADDLYVHSAHGSRAVNLERWFSGLERVLATVVRQLHHGKDPVVHLTMDDCTGLLMAVLGLECRSPYNLQMIERRLSADADLRRVLDPDPTVPVRQHVLENLVHQVSDKVRDYTPTDMVFMVAPASCSWLLCDRPYFHDPDSEYRFVVLTSKILLGFKRSEDGYQFNLGEATTGILDLVNHQIALQAREWLVADSPSSLAKFEAVVKSPEWAERVAADHITFAPIRNLRTGWRISS
jgi:hypothetical protein